MRKKILSGANVLDDTLEKLRSIYRSDDRPVVAFSGGKDSTVLLELCIRVAREEGRLPVEAVFVDDEITLPGVREFVEATADRTDEVDLLWIRSFMPYPNVLDREVPFFWSWDPALKSLWVHPPHPYSEFIEGVGLRNAIDPVRFPWPDGPWGTSNLIALIGIRAEESPSRHVAYLQRGNWISPPDAYGVRDAWPLIAWNASDIWLAIKKFGFRYASTYDTFFRYGLPPHELRLSSIAVAPSAIKKLHDLSVLFPDFFSRVIARLGVGDSMKSFARGSFLYPIPGPNRPYRTYKAIFEHFCEGEGAPAWIRPRAAAARRKILSYHAVHSSSPLFPDASPCPHCPVRLKSWRDLVKALWNGDPNGNVKGLSKVPLEDFRAKYLKRIANSSRGTRLSDREAPPKSVQPKPTIRQGT